MVRRMIASVLVVIGLATPAHAVKELTTPRFRVVVGDDVECAVVNAGTKPVVIRMEIFEYTGLVVAETPADVTLQPSESQGLSTDNVNIPHCRVTVLDGSAKKLRANMIFRDPNLRATFSVDAR